MTNPSISLQDLRRKLYLKAKAENGKHFWGLYVHVCKEETLYEAYRLAKRNKGAPGIDGVTFESIESEGLAGFISEIRQSLLSNKYRPLPNCEHKIPKSNGKFRILKIPTVHANYTCCFPHYSSKVFLT
jgi:RNA-directed DNA polymerase